MTSIMADIAQLVEPRIVIPVVAGSIPVIRPIFSPHPFLFFISLFLIAPLHLVYLLKTVK